MLQTFVPIWISPDGTVAVAEMSQALAPITSAAAARWNMIALICGVLLLGAVAMIVVTSLAQPSPSSNAAGPGLRSRVRPVRRGGNPGARGRGGRTARRTSRPGFREIDELRRTAESRARASEQDLQSVRTQLKDALAQVTLLEEELTVLGTGQQDCEACATDSARRASD